VYENKGHDDIMPEKNSDFVSENTNSERNFADSRQIWWYFGPKTGETELHATPL
jgi:hypothetical protein